MERLIRFFSSDDEDFIRKHFKDKAVGEKMIASNRLRAKITIGIIGSFLLVTAIAVGYARMKIVDAQARQTDVASLKTQVEQCAEATKRQLTDAAAARSRAEEANLVIQTQLEECSKKKKSK